MDRQLTLLDPREDLLTEDECEKLTRRYWLSITETYTLAWRQYEAEVDESCRARLEQTPTMRPQIVNALATSYGRDAFPEAACDALGSEIRHCRQLNVQKILLSRGGRSVLLRWKKLNSDLIVPRSSMGTECAHDYFNHQPLPIISNSATRVTIGYTADASGARMTGIYLSSQVGECLRFAIRIDDQENWQLGSEGKETKSSTANVEGEIQATSPIRISPRQKHTRKVEG